MENSSTGTRIGKRLTVGIDVGDRHSRICVLDEEGEVVEAGFLMTEEAAFRSRFAGIEPCLTTMEVGTHSPWLSRLLEGLGHECLVANPATLKGKNRKKSDKIDAEKLARWARSDPKLLEPVRHAGAEIQADMALIHSRRSLIEARTKLINRARGLVKSFGSRLPRCDADQFAMKVKDRVPEALAGPIEPLLRMIAGLTAEIGALDKRVAALAEKYSQATAPLMQVDSIGPLIATTYALTLRDPGRFPRSRQVGAYLGLTPRQQSSGQSEPELSITKAGNVYLRVLLVNAANRVLGPFGSDCDLRRWGLKKAEGGKSAKKRAIVAVARKLAVLLHHLWLTGEEYEPLRRPEAANEPPPPPSAQPSGAVKVRPSDAFSRFQTLTAPLKNKP